MLWGDPRVNDRDQQPLKYIKRSPDANTPPGMDSVKVSLLQKTADQAGHIAGKEHTQMTVVDSVMLMQSRGTGFIYGHGSVMRAREFSRRQKLTDTGGPRAGNHARPVQTPPGRGIAQQSALHSTAEQPTQESSFVHMPGHDTALQGCSQHHDPAGS